MKPLLIFGLFDPGEGEPTVSGEDLFSSDVGTIRRVSVRKLDLLFSVRNKLDKRAIPI